MITSESGNTIESAFQFMDKILTPRQLYVNFDLYTEGDPEFKKELGTQVIGNIQEFRQSLSTSVRENNPDVFLKTHHKVKFTLGILNDKEFNDMAEEVEKDLVSPNHDKSATLRYKQFENLCNSIIRSLSIEINGVDPEI